MRKLVYCLLGSSLLLLTACSPVKQEITNQYKLSAFSAKRMTRQAGSHTILVTPPEAAAGYQTEQMLYLKKPYEINAFAHNAWFDEPADMLLPLMVQSLQYSGYFYAVASSPSAERADYRLDTQLIELQQNFLTRPSQLQFTVKIVLTRTSDNRIIGSRLISKRIPCAADTPYGGVVAANAATRQFTAELVTFIISHTK
ncbi:ABC-type transport auxiliary lipoprotein family protein [Legionella dresdenensis]|uniref:ABC-type transport auxiliary lipoprotein family protein n=1 Tax=Legionella dresdenensis TaxID=450200 RepID=A0ABV8CD02_9GAMM